MRFIFRIKTAFLLSFLFILFLPNITTSQTLPSDLSNLSDEQIYSYWQQAKSQGYSLAQIKVIAQAKGISAAKIEEMEQRLNGLTNNEDAAGGEQIDNTLEIIKSNTNEPGSQLLKENKDPLFGYDFFNNSNITFTPNTNLATPTNYQLGPGDDIVINIWGAAENTYNMSVDREGAVRISGVGPVYVNGLSIEDATMKIKGVLSRIYSGVNARDDSPYKVFVGVSLTNVRTVQVNIIGEVKVPGTYSLNALSSVLNALYASGGPTKQGTFRNIKLIRSGNEVATFDIYKYLLEGSQEGNKNLQDGDVIIVSPYLSRITISGAVKRPGVYEIKPDENFGDLIDFMSGFTSVAYKERLLLERIDGDRRKVKEILYDQVVSEALKDGDKIIVNEIIDKFENRVQIEGAVYRPGVYELTKGLTLKNLITKAAGISEVAFIDRGLLFRTKDGVNQNVTPFSVNDILNGTNDISLEPNDVVKIFNKYSLTENSFLTISGAVNTPNQFSFVENMSVEDLILLGGGLEDGANTNKIDIYRKIKDDQFETLTESFRVSANGKLTLQNGEQFILQPNDRVSVRYLKGYGSEVNVSVMGEAKYPGAYSMEQKDMKISDLIEKAGGLSPYAYVKGASLLRRNPFFKEVSLKSTIDELESNEQNLVENLDLNNQQSLRVGIDLEDILNSKDSKHNLILKNGDVIDIPSIKQTIKVDGEVLVPSLVRFDKTSTLRDYINKSGGFSDNAKRSKSYVIYLNGDIATTKHFLFFRSYPKLEPGAAIIVPTRPERKGGLNTQEVIGLTTGLATLGLLINSIIK